ncbi:MULTISPECIES: DUF5808 domain-containing protein [Isoptericola]|uniref:DUF5808 domain-containing protein n=1 Tax=Isoptericola sediminis TaxID=2733572 RepID=A0A849K5L0_9MICO|nr:MULTISPECIES: DUF5808 domain-containing protein [Isoptericola]MDO8145879.1 hypothetical protein [Isoptericola sp. 178]MDO8147794.1 hypothetical protein [Isoptericola sp. b515]MDO8149947.1 hypothetical protein [Isoptericola sp. b408]NNU27065.1 hypothetical protein [Isoptericola sediminis]
MDTEKSGKKKSGGIKKFYKVVMLAIAVAAVTKELRKDPEDREWHGKVGFVPYEFRMPTISRAKERLWDPEAEHVLGPQVFGVGWTVNVGRVVALVKERVAG